MKKIINSILAFVTLFSVTSCDLDMDPETAIRPEDAYTMEYCEPAAVFSFWYWDSAWEAVQALVFL